MLKTWPMCWWSAVLLYLRSPLLPAAWVEEIRPLLWSGKSLALVRAALRWIRSNSDTLSYFWASGAVFVWRGVCVSFVLLLDLQWVNHCSHFKLWRQRFLPMRHHSSRACVMWADQAIYVLTQKTNFHLRLIHFILFLASPVLMETTIYSVYKSYLVLRTLHFNWADFDVMADR